MSGFNEFIDSIIGNNQANELFLLVVLVCSALFFLLFWLIFRKPRLWYWKINEQASVLKEIDLKLQEIGRGLSCHEEATSQVEPLKTSEPPAAKEDVLEESPQACKGKSGRIYTEAELDALIKE